MRFSSVINNRITLIIKTTIMKKSLMTLALAAACMSCVEAQHSLTVKLSDITNDTVTIGVVNKEMRDYERQDKVVPVNGEFTYDFKGTKARMAMLSMKTAEGPARLQVYLVPGEQGTLTGTTKSCSWSGTKFYTEMAELEKTTDPVEGEISALMQDYQQKMAAGANRDSLQKAVTPAYEALQKKINDASLSFIKANPSSGVSVTLLQQVEDKEAAMGMLSADVKKGVFSDLVDAEQASIDKEKARKEAAKAVADGCMAPDFTLNDINGKPLALSSLRGKYVILDFWGSWCIWCIRGMPEMKKYYEKYKGKLEILGVDCNDTDQKWKDAVKKHELPWKHVYNPRSSKVLTTYAVQGFPTKVIIDPQGKIVKTIVGEDPAFYTTLDELLK